MRRVAADYESHWIKPGMITPASVCMSWYDGQEAGLVGRLDALNLWRKWLLDPDVLIIGHNLFFDLGVAVADDPALMPMIMEAFDDGRISCVQVRQQMIDIARGELMSADDDGNGKQNYRRRKNGEFFLAGLKLTDLVLWWFDEVRTKIDSWQTHYNELDGIPLEDWPLEAKQYVFDDARDAWRIWDAQQGYIESGDREWLPEAVLPNQPEQMRAAWALHLMAAWGMITDAEATAHLREVLEAEQAAALVALKGTGIYVPKKKSDPTGPVKRSMKVIYDKLKAAFVARGIPCPMTAGGNDKYNPDGSVAKKGRDAVPQTDKETLKLSGDPDLLVLANTMQGKKILDTYVPVLERGVHWPICPRYNVLVETGRTSCRNPNMQNPPRKGGVRECFIPRLGHIFATVDFDTAELRSLAQVCLKLVGYSRLGEALQRGEDPHVLLAAQMLRLDPAEAMRRYALGDKIVDDMRQFCKIGNFGFPGGLGEETFIEYAAGYDVVVSLKEAHELRAAWFATWREMRDYFAKISGMTGPAGASVMQFRVGKDGKRMLHRRRGDVYFTQAANGMFQGLTADGAKEALWRVSRACYTAQPGDVLFGVRPVAFLHDEIMSEIPYDEAEPERASAAAYEIARIMREAMQEWVPDIPIKCGPSMFRRWYKGAKAVHVDRGGNKVLVPSRPQQEVDGAGNVKIKWVHDVGELQAAA